MKEGGSFPLVADKATWVWTPTIRNSFEHFKELNQENSFDKNDRVRLEYPKDLLIQLDQYVLNKNFQPRTISFQDLVQTHKLRTIGILNLIIYKKNSESTLLVIYQILLNK